MNIPPHLGCGGRGSLDVGTSALVGFVRRGLRAEVLAGANEGCPILIFANVGMTSQVGAEPNAEVPTFGDRSGQATEKVISPRLIDLVVRLPFTFESHLDWVHVAAPLRDDVVDEDFPSGIAHEASSGLTNLLLLRADPVGGCHFAVRVDVYGKFGH